MAIATIKAGRGLKRIRKKVDKVLYGVVILNLIVTTVVLLKLFGVV